MLLELGYVTWLIAKKRPLREARNGLSWFTSTLLSGSSLGEIRDAEHAQPTPTGAHALPRG